MAPLKRQTVLLTLLASRPFSSQEDVVEAMREAGFEVTQPSVSRDFRQLGIVKLNGCYQQAPLSKPEMAQGGEITTLVRGIEAIGSHLVVIKTGAGAASVVADSLDKMGFEGVAGTIAGDDTIFVATRSKDVQQQLYRVFQIMH